MSNYSAGPAPALIPVCNTCGQTLLDSRTAPTVGPGHAARARSSEVPPIAPGTLVGGRYRIESQIGCGGAGEIYRAEDLKLDQTVALKFFAASLQGEPEALARFHREVRLARQIAHPNICRVFDIGEAEGRFFISMDFVKGEDLHSLYDELDGYPTTKLCRLGCSCAPGWLPRTDRACFTVI